MVVQQLVAELEWTMKAAMEQAEIAQEGVARGLTVRTRRNPRPEASSKGLVARGLVNHGKSKARSR